MQPDVITVCFYPVNLPGFQKQHAVVVLDGQARGNLVPLRGGAQQSGQLLFDAFPRAGAKVGGDGQAEIGRQQILGNEPQPAEVMAFGPRFVKQQMRAGAHGADWF